MTRLDRLRACGHTAVDGSGVMVRMTPGSSGSSCRAGFAGLATCGSVWACPVCAAKVAAERAGELGAVLTAAGEAGHQVAMVTLTVREAQAVAPAGLGSGHEGVEPGHLGQGVAL